MSASICYTVATNDKYYLDLLENGKFAVSFFDKRLKEFTDGGEAIFYYLSKTVDVLKDIKTLSPDEITAYLQEQLENRS